MIELQQFEGNPIHDIHIVATKANDSRWKLAV